MAIAAMGSAAAIMAYQVALRATRDTLFLSNFHVRSLPLMVSAAAVLSIAVAFLATRAIVTLGPARFVPVAFLASALLTLAEWGLVLRQPGPGAVIVYLHVAVVTPVLLSGFWSIIYEEFDARSAKRSVGRIAAVGTLGGLAGGILAERLTAWAGPASTLPALALLQLWCAWSTKRLPPVSARPTAPETISAHEAGRRLVAIPYLRNLALLVLGSSVSATLLDFVFKAQTFDVARQSLDLMRVFSAFYAAVAVVTFIAQAFLSRVALERAGVAPTIGTLPGALVVGGTVAVLAPGPVSVALARGLGAALQGSLFRAGYDVLYTAIPAAEKRATKTLVDVGCDRLGDLLGSGIIALVLLASPGGSTRVLLGGCVLLAAATLLLVAQLRQGYVASLEQGLRQGVLDPTELRVTEMTTRTTLDRALLPLAPRTVEQLVDALFDPASDVRERSRIPRQLAVHSEPRVVDALTRGLGDARFDVRYACGRALVRLVVRERSLAVDRNLILGAVLKEADRERSVWASQRLLEHLHEAGEDELVDGFLRERAGRSLEHVFTLLSLVLPREPLRIAFRGLLVGDSMVRGTALEYLENVLPVAVRDALWPHLEPGRPPRRAGETPAAERARVLNDLLRSNASIEINLEELRRKHRDGVT
jgi:hypothetical protein